MTILNVRTVYDHYIKESHPGMYDSFASKDFIYEAYSTLGNLIAHSLVLMACIPLLAIRRLPSPLDRFPVVGFYQNQWLDELEYIDTPLRRVSYAAARVVDGGRLMANYNPLTQALSKRKTGKSLGANQCDGQCKCRGNGACGSSNLNNSN